MTFSTVTGGDQLTELGFHEHGAPFAGGGGGIGGSTTKCCASGTCDTGPAWDASRAEPADPRDPAMLAGALGSLG
jgi:hypothetical protein